MAEIYDWGTRTDWVLAFNRKGPDGLVNGKAPGQPSKLTDVSAGLWCTWWRAGRSGHPRCGALAVA